MNSACHCGHAPQSFVSPGLGVRHVAVIRVSLPPYQVARFRRQASLCYTMPVFIWNRSGRAITGEIRLWNVTITYVLVNGINNGRRRHTDAPRARTQLYVVRYAIIRSVRRPMGPRTDYILSYVVPSGLSNSGVLITCEPSWKKPCSGIRAHVGFAWCMYNLNV